jgi:hypothetical protein
MAHHIPAGNMRLKLLRETQVAFLAKPKQRAKREPTFASSLLVKLYV